MAKKTSKSVAKAPKAEIAKKVPKANKKAPPAASIEDEKHDNTYLPTIPVNFLPRVGFENYETEIQERLQDVDDEKREVFYILPIRMPKEVYKNLLQATLTAGRSSKNRQWTEQNQVLSVLVAGNPSSKQ